MLLMNLSWFGECTDTFSFENYKELKWNLTKNQKWLASSFSIFCKYSSLCFEHLTFSTNGCVCIYVGASLALSACYFHTPLNEISVNSVCIRGVLKDAQSFKLCCCILFFICLTIFSGMLLKWKHFIAKINLCCYYFCISSRKINNVAKLYIVQNRIIKYVYFANNMKIDWGERSTFVIAQTEQQNPLLNLAVLFFKGI
jgi:hypothetical protein